jgi:hypothetical protein
MRRERVVLQRAASECGAPVYRKTSTNGFHGPFKLSPEAPMLEAIVNSMASIDAWRSALQSSYALNWRAFAAIY